MDKRAKVQELYVNFQFSNNSRHTTWGEHGDVMYSTGNIVGNVIRWYGDGWLLYCSDHIIRYINAESLCCPPETNVILHAKYTLI